jgi:hypothetical protein
VSKARRSGVCYTFVLFIAEERGSHELKGVPEPVTLEARSFCRFGQIGMRKVNRVCSALRLPRACRAAPC